MKLFAVIYIKTHLAVAMYLWPTATMEDCININKQYAVELKEAPGIKSGKITMKDIELKCEWHNSNPIK